MEDINQLILRAQKGDKDAYGRIYDIFNKRIWRYCYYNIKDPEGAQDITQETFIKAWRSLPSFTIKEGGSLQAYLFRIARNLIIDSSRKKKEVSIEEIGEIEIKENFEDGIDKEADRKKVHSALDKLDELERQIVILRFFEELSFEEVAKITEVNEGALRVRMHRILKKLKGILENE